MGPVSLRVQTSGAETDSGTRVFRRSGKRANVGTIRVKAATQRRQGFVLPRGVSKGFLGEMLCWDLDAQVKKPDEPLAQPFTQHCEEAGKRRHSEGGAQARSGRNRLGRTWARGLAEGAAGRPPAPGLHLPRCPGSPCRCCCCSCCRPRCPRPRRPRSPCPTAATRRRAPAASMSCCTARATTPPASSRWASGGPAPQACRADCSASCRPTATTPPAS